MNSILTNETCENLFFNISFQFLTEAKILILVN